MTVHHQGLASILGGPVVADGQPVLACFAGRLTVEGELAHLARATTLHLRPQAGVRDDQPAIVEHVMADQAVDEGGYLLGKRGRLLGELLQ